MPVRVLLRGQTPLPLGWDSETRSRQASACVTLMEKLFFLPFTKAAWQCTCCGRGRFSPEFCLTSQKPLSSKSSCLCVPGMQEPAATMNPNMRTLRAPCDSRGLTGQCHCSGLLRPADRPPRGLRRRRLQAPQRRAGATTSLAARPERASSSKVEVAAQDVPLWAGLGVRLRGGEPPAPRGLRLSRPLGLGSPRTHEGREGRRLPCEKLVPFLGTHVKEGVDGKRLKFLRDVLGARVVPPHNPISECRRRPTTRCAVVNRVKAYGARKGQAWK